ncbi:MAG TPA: hypothetical protein ENH80_06105 [Phycisphaerae bacterium]|nr:hypothetical protein [Phycisphaerae bacterium]HDZ43497.1 hypothetical protein [Phycisphaerae bacterium]
MVSEHYQQGVWVGTFDELVPFVFTAPAETTSELSGEQTIGPGQFPAAVGLSEKAYIVALRYLGPTRVRTAAKQLKSVIAYESTDLTEWSSVEVAAIDDDDVLKLSACRLDEATDRVVIFLQKAGGFKLIVLNGDLSERLAEWEFTSPGLAEATPTGIRSRRGKIDVVALDGMVYAFWDQKIDDSTRDLMYVRWQPDVSLW